MDKKDSYLKDGRYLSEHKLTNLAEATTVEGLNYSTLTSLIINEEAIGQWKPESVVQIDPRSLERIVYNPRRAKRPHDNHHPKGDVSKKETPCVICDGKSTGIVDLTPLERNGTYTFINKNLFPVFYPESRETSASFSADPWASVEGAYVSGMHFLQWSSNIHDEDWYNMSSKDRLICVKALARLEKALLMSGGPYEPNTLWSGDPNDQTSGFVSIIKNYGRLVGGSLDHGHQQVAYTNIMPLKFRNNLHFEARTNEKYGAWILKNNPSELTVKEYDCGRLLVPHYMRRPYDMQFVFRDTSKRYLFQLNDEELEVLAEVLQKTTLAIMDLMPQMGRETAYNFVVHNGPGAGIYVEFLPYTQEYGGYEHAGIYLCQGDPKVVANDLREYFQIA